MFLFIENGGLESPFGNLYISDEKGRYFTLSISNVIKGSAVDFERVSSLDGTYIVNRYNNNRDDSTYAMSVRPDSGPVREFDEADMIAQDAKKSRMQRPSTMGGSEGSKQLATSRDVRKIPDSIAASEVQENVRTYITHNKGAKWELLRSPTVTSKGAPIDCHVEDDCSLHLEIYSHMG